MVSNIHFKRASVGPKVFQVEPRTLYRKEMETHELIFSWISWLVVMLMGMYIIHKMAAAVAKSQKMVAILQLIG